VTSGRATDEVVRDRVMAGVSVPDSPLIRDVLAYAKELAEPLRNQ